MLMTIDELKSFIETSESDAMLEARLSALEFMIRGYTNNNFQDTARRCKAVITDGRIYSDVIPFKVGDTVQISQSECNNGLYTVEAVAEGYFTVVEDVDDDRGSRITKVKYPPDVKIGAANLIKWETDNKDKAGIASETISRHSVTYVAADAANSVAGYPKTMLGFLRPYRKARF